MGDPLTLLGIILFNDPQSTCQSGSDSNDDGNVDLADPINLLNSLFQMGSEPPAPLDCGFDPTRDTSCESNENNRPLLTPQWVDRR